MPTPVPLRVERTTKLSVGGAASFRAAAAPSNRGHPSQQSHRGKAKAKKKKSGSNVLQDSIREEDEDAYTDTPACSARVTASGAGLSTPGGVAQLAMAASTSGSSGPEVSKRNLMDEVIHNMKTAFCASSGSGWSAPPTVDAAEMLAAMQARAEMAEAEVVVLRASLDAERAKTSDAENRVLAAYSQLQAFGVPFPRVAMERPAGGAADLIGHVGTPGGMTSLGGPGLGMAPSGSVAAALDAALELALQASVSLEPPRPQLAPIYGAISGTRDAESAPRLADLSSAELTIIEEEEETEATTSAGVGSLVVDVQEQAVGAGASLPPSLPPPPLPPSSPMAPHAGGELRPAASAPMPHPGGAGSLPSAKQRRAWHPPHGFVSHAEWAPLTPFVSYAEHTDPPRGWLTSDGAPPDACDAAAASTLPAVPPPSIAPPSPYLVSIELNDGVDSAGEDFCVSVVLQDTRDDATLEAATAAHTATSAPPLVMAAPYGTDTLEPSATSAAAVPASVGAAASDSTSADAPPAVRVCLAGHSSAVTVSLAVQPRGDGDDKRRHAPTSVAPDERLQRLDKSWLQQLDEAAAVALGGGRGRVVHGTLHSSWQSIVASGGLHRMSRRHISLAEDRPGAMTISSGSKPRSAEVFVWVDVRKAMAAGVPFYRSETGEILTPGRQGDGLVPFDVFASVADQSGRLWCNGDWLEGIE